LEVANVIGISKNSQTLPDKSSLLSCQEMYARAFNEAMHALWTGGVKSDNVLLQVTDAAPYMVKAA
jgi:hypothetical protein